MNLIILCGRVSTDIELRYTPQGTAVATFGLAVDRKLSKEKKKEAQDKGQATADFPRVVVWGNQARALAEHSKKGKKINVQGEIRTSSYKNNNGDTVYKTDVVASNVEILEWTTNKPEDENFSYGGDFQAIEDDEDIPF